MNNPSKASRHISGIVSKASNNSCREVARQATFPNRGGKELGEIWAKVSYDTRPLDEGVARARRILWGKA